VTVSFRLDVDDAAHEVGTGATGADGWASVTIPTAALSLGSHTIYAHYEGGGTSVYETTSASTTANVVP